MTVKQWLSRARQCDREISVLKEAKDRERDRLLSITASLDGDPVSHSSEPHKFDGYVELVDILDKRIKELYAIKKEILTLIDKVPDSRFRRLLTLYYVSGKTWSEVETEMAYSHVHMRRLHGWALVSADNIWRQQTIADDSRR